MISPAGLCDQACRYRREAYRASAEAMDLRIALTRMGMRPSAEQIAMSRRFDEAAREAAERASIELLFLLNQRPAFERAA